MAAKQKHFVLIHGSCHGAWCWYKVATLLKSGGHKVTALDLAASGINPKKVTDIHSFSNYCEPLMEFMASLQPEERVILVGHSLGGLSLSAAMENFPHKISAAVFVTAFMPGPDLSFPIFMEEYFYKQFDNFMDSQYFFDNGPSNKPTSITLGPKCMAEKLYQLSPPEDLTLATLLVRPTPLFDEAAILTKEKYGSVPRIYLICDKDLIISEGLQRLMIEKDPTNEVIVIEDSDHMPMFSKPQEMCSCLEEIARKYI